MEKRNDRLFLSWARLCAAIFVVVVAIATSTAKADIPPAIEHGIAGTPTEQKLIKGGWNPSNNTLNPTKAKETFTTGNAAKQTASTDLKGHHPDSYGNKTPVNVNTQTTLPKTDTYAKAGAAYMGAAAVGGALNAEGGRMGEAIGAGNYGEAAQYAIGGLLEGLKGLGNSVTGGAISGAEAVIDGYKKGKTPTTPAEAAAYAQAAKALSKAEEYAAFTPLGPNDKRVLEMVSANCTSGCPYVTTYAKIPQNTTGSPTLEQVSSESWNVVLGGKVYGQIKYGGAGIVDVTSSNKAQINASLMGAAGNITPESFLLTADEAANAIAPLLQQMLNDQNANHKELLNALWGMGALSKDNTQTQVMGTTQQNTFLSAPYTPAGSQQAQQTKVTVAPDGTVSTSVVARPDLAANTSQAPTRQEVGTQANTQTERPAKEGSTAESPDICAKNPNSLMCMEMGNADYEDPVIPENKIDLKFEPSSIFKSDATCPAAKPFTIMNQTYAVEYQPMCDFALGARPMIIALGIVIAMGMAYATVKEL